MVALQSLIGFDRLLEDGGHEVTRRVKWRIAVADDPESAHRIGVTPGDKCFTFEKLLFADGEPAIWLRDMFPLSAFATLPRKGRELPESMFEISDLMFRERIDHAEVELIPSKSDGRVAELFGAVLGEPYILLHEVHYSAQSNLLGISEVHVRDRFLRFKSLRRR
jgi:DNA-binding GntR family transcriptional regulator